MLSGYGDIGGLMVIVDYPTVNEYKNNAVMYGLPKRIIDTLIRKHYHGPIWWTAAYKSGYSKGETAVTLSKYYEEYHTILEQEIDMVQPKKILVLGATAYAILNYPQKTTGIKHEQGKAFLYKGIYTVVTYNPYSIIKENDLYRDLEYGVQKLLTKDTPVEKIIPGMYLPTTYQMLVNALNSIAGEKVISCDIETTGLKFKQHVIDSIAFGTRKNVNVVIPKHLLAVDTCKELIRSFMNRSNVLFVYHNGKFDIQFIQEYLGETLTGAFADTMLMHYALDERPMGKASVHSLKDLARMYFDAEDYKFDFKSFWAKEDKTFEDYKPLYFYQCYDTQYTIRLFDIFKKQLQEQDMLKLCTNLLFPASKAYTAIEMTGIKVDRMYLEILAQEYKKKVEDMLYPLWDKSGKLHLNPLAPKQVNMWLKEIGITPSARRVSMQGECNLGTAKDDLLQYAALLEFRGFKDYAEAIRLVIEARKLNKLNNTYFEGILKWLDIDDRVRTSIRIHGTSTGRVSSIQPNLQNIPTRLGKIVKNSFIADEECYLLQFDYKQLELRIAAYVSQDEVMASVFNSGVDLHVVVAAAMFKKEESEVTPFERFLAKAVDFGTMYGRSASALVDGTEMDYYVQLGGTRPSIEDMQAFIDNFLDGFPKLKKWIAYMHKYVLAKHEVSTIFGRKRRFPYVIDDRKLLGEIKRAGVNTPIQSAASDLCLSALIRLNNELPKDCKILLSVHDSILLQVPQDKLYTIAPIVKDVMENGVIKTDFIKFEVDAEYGTKWGTMNKLEIK